MACFARVTASSPLSHWVGFVYDTTSMSIPASSSSAIRFATLELCGPQNLSASEMLSTIENVIGQEIKLKYLTDDEIRRSMSERKAPEYSIETLLKMFLHYNNGDFCGNPFVTTAILKRSPTTFAEFLKRELK